MALGCRARQVLPAFLEASLLRVGGAPSPSPTPAADPSRGHCLQVALPPAGPATEAGTAELHVQTRAETALLAPDGPLLPPALRCPQTAQPGGMEAREQGKCVQAAGGPRRRLSLKGLAVGLSLPGGC